MYIQLPDEIQYLLQQIHQRRFEAYLVGGCVRDALLGRPIHDYDIATNARPQDIMDIFHDHKVIETGLEHGTVTVVIDHKPVEVTTYRIDVFYTDHRRPDQVFFTSHLIEDLRRRDFTINAMAYNAESGIVDYFGGIKDIKNRLIRTVGSPDERFKEDALRIMRALRFSAVLGFEIHEGTKASIHAQKESLRSISPERIQSEFAKMICGQFIQGILIDFWDVLQVIIPQAHKKRVEKNERELDEKCLSKIIANTPPVLHLRMAILLYCIIKPGTEFHPNEDQGLYMASLAKDILTWMRFDKKTVQKVYLLIYYSGLDLEEDPRVIKKGMNKLTVEGFKDLLTLKKAEIIASAPEGREGLARLKRIDAIVDEIIRSKECYSIKGLAVDGQDLMAIGIPQGKLLGQVLEQLLEEVIEERVANDKEDLLVLAKEIHKKEVG